METMELLAKSLSGFAYYLIGIALFGPILLTIDPVMNWIGSKFPLAKEPLQTCMFIIYIIYMTWALIGLLFLHNRFDIWIENIMLR
jgi:hypothetical protein